jgi:hypothetical protein|tara:strand:- start:2498 stop:2818 length:321 start_codon:yes stop_codon:yes gene_type:complete
MTYDWEFGELDCYKSSEGQTDVVFDVVWRLTARDGDSSWSDGGHLEVNYQSGNPFISFESLTKADVQGWCEAGLDVDAIKTALDAKVAEQESPATEEMTPPWQDQS